MIASLKPIEPTCPRAFTLLEVVLAISLTSVVIALLMTAVGQFIIHIDSGRTQVETAQLARTLLKQIADDLRAVRYANPSAESSSNQSSTSNSESPEAADSGTQDNSGSNRTSSDNGSQDNPATTSPSGVGETGIVGSKTELRITRSGSWRWERLTEQLETQSAGTEDDEAHYALMAQAPKTVRYFVREGDEMSTAMLAAEGVDEKPAENIVGLCRERVATEVARSGTSDSDPTSISASDMLEGSYVELLAPEVIDLQFAYSFGGELYDEWNATEEEGLPNAVEIRLTLLKQPDPFDVNESEERANSTTRHSANDVVEFHQIVKLPEVQAARKIPVASAPQTASSSQQPEGSSTNTENQ